MALLPPLPRIVRELRLPSQETIAANELGERGLPSSGLVYKRQPSGRTLKRELQRIAGFLGIPATPNPYRRFIGGYPPNPPVIILLVETRRFDRLLRGIVARPRGW